MPCSLFKPYHILTESWFWCKLAIILLCVCVSVRARARFINECHDACMLRWTSNAHDALTVERKHMLTARKNWEISIASAYQFVAGVYLNNFANNLHVFFNFGNSIFLILVLLLVVIIHLADKSITAPPTDLTLHYPQFIGALNLNSETRRFSII